MSVTVSTTGIFLNDRPHALVGGATLFDLMRELGLADRKGFAAAVNTEVVPRPQWESRELSQGDRVLVIRATQGG
jgi:sulfur carrier protein